VSAEADFIKRWHLEGCKLTSYPDPNGVWTIGYGHTMGVFPGATCTQAQAEAWLEGDAQEATQALLYESPGPFAPGAQLALTDFVFNLGVGHYRTSTLKTYVDREDWPSVKTELLKWDHCGGQVLGGLLLRRQAEADLIEAA
jgi:lysozyme